MFKSKDSLFHDEMTARERATTHAAEAARLLASAPAMSKHGAIAQVHATLAVYWQREAELAMSRRRDAAVTDTGRFDYPDGEAQR
jgi:hypothetical protein